MYIPQGKRIESSMLKDRIKIEQDKKARGAFTLLEVLLAVTIFSLVTACLYTTFRVGTRAYTAGQREINRMQNSRVIFDTISRDLRSIYYRPETSYNINMRQMVNRFHQQYLRAEIEGRLDEFLYGDKDDSEDEGTPNPYEFGIEIDLDFRAENKDDVDTMTFVRYQYDDGITGIQPWGLGRITYVMEDDELIRMEEDVIEPMKDHEGNAIEEKVPRRDVLAKGVKKFALYYGFFFDEDWMEAEDWHSNEKRYRNPTEELDEEEPDYVQRLREEQMKPVDGLPAFVRGVLEIEDEKQPQPDKGKKPPKKKGKTHWKH